MPETPAVSTRERYDTARESMDVAQREYEQAKKYRNRKGGKAKLEAASERRAAAREELIRAEDAHFPRLTADDFIRQVSESATSPEEAQGIVALAQANAEYRGESLGDWVSKNIGRVELTDQKDSVYLAQNPDGPPGGAPQGTRFVRGEMQPLKDGRMVVRAFKESRNLATLAHELGHVFRRTLLPEDLRTVEKAYGLREGKKWSRADEERFSRNFERYLRDGNAPTKKLATVFEKFKTWLTNIYRNLAGGPLREEIPPEVRAVFDRMLGATDADIAEKYGGDTSFDFGYDEFGEFGGDPEPIQSTLLSDTEIRTAIKDANRGISKLKKKELFPEEFQAIWDSLPDADKAQTWRAAADFAQNENELRSTLKNQFNGLFGGYTSAGQDVKVIYTKSGKRYERRVSDAGRASARARMVEYNTSDYTTIRGFDLKVAQLTDDETYNVLRGEAYARGNGSLEDGLFDILRGGAKQFDSVPTEEYLLNLLNEEYERRESKETAREEVRGTAGEGDAVPEGGNGSDAVLPAAGPPAAAEPAAAAFELSREGSPDKSSIVEAYTPDRSGLQRAPTERQPLMVGMPEDMNPGTLVGQQGLFGGNEPPLQQDVALPPGPDFPTGIKNAVTAADRAKMGREARPPVEPETFDQWNQSAQATLERDPQAGQKIVDELLVNNRPLTEREVFTVLNHKARIMNEQNDLGIKLADAYDSGDQQAIDDLTSRYNTLSDQVHAVNVAMEETGTKQGRALASRKAMLNADYSLAAMEARMRGALGGRQLTTSERADIIRLNERIQELEKNIAEGRKRARQKAFEEGSDRERKRSKVKKESWTPADIDLSPDSNDVDIASAAKQAARFFYRQGIEDREDNIMAVHELLQPYIGEGWTLDNARDAVSDYGRVRELSKRKEDVWMRGYRGELQQVRKLVDMLAGRPPKITGTEREEPTQEKRDLTKKVNEYKRRYNIESGNDASNARSALDAVKTRLRNQIADLQKQIKTREKLIKRKTDIQYDEEANRLKSQRDELKTQFDEIFGKPGITDEQRLKMATRAAERSLQEYERRIAEGDFATKSADPLTSPELEAMKAKRDAARAEYEMLREQDPQYRAEQDVKWAEGLKKRLADKKAALAERLANPKAPADKASKRNGPYDAETTQLQDEVGKLEELVRQAEAVPRALVAAEKQAAEYERQIAEGDFTRTPNRQLVDLNLDAVRAKRDALRKERDRLRKLDPEWQQEQQRKDLLRVQARILKRAERLADRMARDDYQSKPPERANGPYDEYTTRQMEELDKLQREFDDKAYDANLKVSLESDIKNLKRQLATGKFEEKPPREVKPLSPEARRLKTQRDILKQQAASKKADQERTFVGRLWQGTGILRMLQTTGEFSFIGRQGGKQLFASIGGLAVGDTQTARTFGRSVRESFKAFAREKDAKASDERMFNSPNLDKYQTAGLRIIHEGEHISGAEEVRISGIIEKLPVLNQLERFNRAARVFYNELRSGAFDAMMASAGRDLTPEQLKALGHFVNVSTGYGSLGKLGASAEYFNHVFYSPRNLAANFQYALGQPLLSRNAAGVRGIIAKQYAKTFIGLAVAYALAALAGADIEQDPRSGDFGKWRFGDTRVDPLMGLQQVTVFGARELSGATKTQKGEIVPIRGENVPYRGATGYDVATRFLRSKLSPNVGLIADLASGQDVVGERVSIGNVASKAGPITYLDIVKAMQDQGVPKGSAMAIAAFFGMGLQTYEQKTTPGSLKNRGRREPPRR